MKQSSNQTDKKTKQTNQQQQNKSENNTKNKKVNSPLPINDKANPELQSNQKNKKNYVLTEANKNNTQSKNETNKKSKQDTRNKNKKEPRRLFSSVSQEKDRNKTKNNTPKKNYKKNKPRNLSMEKMESNNLNSIQETNLKTPNNNNITFQSNKKPTYNIKKIKNKKKNKEETIKINPLIQNYDPNLYGFNLYKHVKENLRNKDKLCKDKITKESYYCIDCKISTCKKCLLFHVHNGHTLIPKYLYYEPNQQIFNEAFSEFDTLFSQNLDYLDNKKLKEELKKIVTDNIDKLAKRLNDIKNKKLKELDKLFENTDGCIKILKEKKSQIENDIKKYFEKQKDFYAIQINESEDTKNKKEINEDPDFDVLKNLKNNVNKDTGMIESNDDMYNSTFLTNYDIFKNTKYINSEICKLINDIKINKEKYLNELNENINKINEDLDKLNKPFNGIFNFNYLTTDFYKMVSDKLNKYNEKIDGMRKYIFDMVNKDGGYDSIEKDNRLAETTIKQRFDNILNYQLSDKDEELTVKTKTGKGNKALHRLSMYLNTGLASIKLSNALQTLSNGSNADTKNHENKSKIIYEKPEDIKLDKKVLQQYFAYENYNTIHNYFRYKKPKKEDEILDELDEGIDIARPVPGTNEMLLYDKKTRNLIKKTVDFDKKKHKYLSFLNGCRSVLVKEMLYIFGGVDQEKKPSKIAYVYYIKTNELKVMPEMLKPHAYHSVEFLDYYKSIIVIGGENSNACEIYDLTTGLWKELPNMNMPRAHCNLYLDKFNHIIYTFFGVVGDITEKNNYTDIIEFLELKRIALGWTVVDYKNKAEMDFKSGYTKILPLSNEMILIYGATNMRDFGKKAAIFLIPKLEIIKIDNKIFKEIKEKSKYSRKLSKILSSYI
jgi:hypothetical protein